MTNKKGFTKTTSKINFPKIEEEILDYWDKNNIFEESIKKNKGKKRFVFYEGPPTANGKPGVHHVEARVFKDLFPRYKTMRGFYCSRKAGWDTHGLPVELEVEKKLGISGKKQIEEYGIQKFCDLCKKSVFEYVSAWQEMTRRIGFWIDLKDAYVTYANTYIESEWNLLKDAHKKGRLYQDYKVLPYCPRCQTSLSSHELALGYKDNVKDPSIFVKFPLKGKNDTYFLVWTTTPWTLPGNVALAVDADANYVEVQVGKDKLIFAEKRLGVIQEEYKIISNMKGKELLDMDYKPLYNFVKYSKRAHYIVAGNFVSLDEGTGIVHTAVMYGEDDFSLGRKYDLPRKHVVDFSGNFIDKVAPWAGMFVKDADGKIMEELENRGLLYLKSTIRHTYPFCWRCGTPLLYYALTSWYLKTTVVKDELIKINNSVNWIPKHIKHGRMGEWLENNRDWALSRTRYWGTPLPVWKCTKCDKEIVVGSLKELAELSKSKLDISTLDLHRPKIDQVVLKCPQCGTDAVRLPFVIDCWFDSGSMPFAQWHYPFENKDKFEEHFPADFIAEAIDQTRGWFYTLQAVSVLVDKGGVYKNAICLGHVLDEKGNKMSKSKGNIVDPWEVINSAGVDAMRWYFYSVISPGESFRFSLNLVKEVNRRFLLTLWNIFNYFITYSNLDLIDKKDILNKLDNIQGEYKYLDEWILTRYLQLVITTTEYLDKYNSFSATKEIESFVNDLSTWYIRRSRERTGTDSSNKKDKIQFYSVLYKILLGLSKVMAPFTPFISEYIFQNLQGGKSVHLEDWPIDEVEGLELDNRLIEKMTAARLVVEKIHAKRKEIKIPVRQPLAKAIVSSNDKNLQQINDLFNLIEEETNVKSLEVKPGKDKVTLDTKITEKLAQEAKTRELIRSVQQERKNMGINLDQYIYLTSPWLPQDKILVQKLKNKALIRELSIGIFKVKEDK